MLTDPPGAVIMKMPSFDDNLILICLMAVIWWVTASIEEECEQRRLRWIKVLERKDG